MTITLLYTSAFIECMLTPAITERASFSIIGLIKEATLQTTVMANLNIKNLFKRITICYINRMVTEQRRNNRGFRNKQIVLTQK